MPSDSLAARTADGARRPIRRIQPSRGLVPIDVGELWRYRELLYFLVWRDIKSRYKQTFLGPLWALLRPLVMMVIFSVIFGGLAGIESGTGMPYPLFVFAGLLAWTYFASALTAGVTSVVGNASLVAKAYFPRIYAPASAVTAPIVDFALSLIVVVGLFLWYRESPSIQVVLLPAFLALALLLALGVALWLSSLTIRYRDIPFALPFATQLWMYATPVIYPVSLVPERFRWLLALNPMTAVVEGFRWSLLGDRAPSTFAVVAGVVSALVLVVSGAYFFRRSERTLADMM